MGPPAEADRDSHEHHDLDGFYGDDRDDLRGEQPRPPERGGAEPLQHAVAPLETRRDPEAHHRRRHDRQCEDAWREEVDRMLIAGGQHVDLGEEDEEEGGDAEGDEEGFSSLQRHRDLGGNLCPQRAHGS